jgi:hypothetical protein
MKLKNEDIDYLFDTEIEKTTIRENNIQINFENMLSFLNDESKEELKWCKTNLESLKSNSKISNKTTADWIERQGKDNLLKCIENDNFISVIDGQLLSWLQNKTSVNEESFCQLKKKLENFTSESFLSVKNFNGINAELTAECKILFIKMKIINILNGDSDVSKKIHTSMGTSEFFTTAVKILSNEEKIKEFDFGVTGVREMYWNFLLLNEMKDNKDINFLDKIINFIEEEPDKNKKNTNELDFKNYKEKFQYFDKIDLIKERTIQNTDSKELKTSELTSGEQVILLSILWEYQVKKFLSNSNKKLILLLDEPDICLHPNAIKNFVDQLKKLVKENSRVQIILTSHNPGTFSLMDDECIFYLDLDDKDKKIKSCEKEPNGKIRLLKGITNNLFFVLKPFKLVLIEGAGDDYLFYQMLYDRLDESCKSGMPVIFRSGGDCMIKNIQRSNFIKKEGDEQEFYNYIYVITDGDVYINTAEAIEYYEKDLNSKKIQEKIDTEIEHDKKGHLFRLKRRNLENYLCDPLNLFVLMNYQIDRIQNIIAEEKIDFFERTLQTLKTQRIECFQPKTDIMIKDVNELKSQNSIEYENLVKNFSDFFQNKFSSIIKVEKNLIVQVKIHNIKERDSFEIKYPSWTLFHDFKKDYKKKFSELGIPDPFKIITANNLKKDNKEKKFFFLGEIIFSVLGLSDAFKIKSKTANKWQTNLLNGYMNSSMIFTDDLMEILKNFKD